MDMPIIELANGVKVANFGSPHPFNFTTGEILPACSPERVKALSLKVVEMKEPNPNVSGVTDIVIRFELTYEVEEALRLAQEREVDVVLVPFPLLAAVKEAGFFPHRFPKIRVIRSADRITKAIYPDRFCR
jgi:hypothetical protein